MAGPSVEDQIAAAYSGGTRILGAEENQTGSGSWDRALTVCRMLWLIGG